MTSEFHEEDKRYTVIQFEQDVKNVTYLYFREGEWFLTESFERSWDHPILPASRYFEVRGFTGPAQAYFEEYKDSQHVLRQAKIVQMNLGQILDTMFYGGKKNVRGN